VDKVVADLQQEPLWYSHVLGAMVASQAGNDLRPGLLKSFESDPDATVRRLAAGLVSLPPTPATQPVKPTR
jgi:hypothetical protein